MSTGADTTGEVTYWLQRWRDGDAAAPERLMPLVYDPLRRLAASRLGGERTDHTLQPTALVHEAFLRLTRGECPQWQDRVHFFAVAAQVMRRILVDHARRLRAVRRDTGGPTISLQETQIALPERAEELLALDDALIRLAADHPRKTKVVEMRFFGGMSIQETADALDISPATVVREWRFARAWLYRDIRKR